METTKMHIEASVTALVEFHKAQCYFSSTIQITALILFHQTQSAESYTKSQDLSLGPSANLIDGADLVVLATSGLIPITLTLAWVSRYGPQSWYLIILSLVAFILATARLASSTQIAVDLGPEGIWTLYFEPSSKCPLGSNWVDYSSSLCGSYSIGRNEIGKHTLAEN